MTNAKEENKCVRNKVYNDLVCTNYLWGEIMSIVNLITCYVTFGG